MKPGYRTKLNFGCSILALAAIALLTLFAYFTSHYGWKIVLELASHFQVQYLSLAAIFLAALACLRRPRLFAIALFCFTLLALPVITWYVPPHRWTRDRADPDLHFFIANINTKNKNYDRVLEIVRQEKPNLALFLEVDRAWQTSLNSLQDILPYSSGRASDYNLGLLLYSARPLEDIQIRFFNDDKNTSIIAKITVADRPITLVATHPFPPVKPSFFTARNRQLDLIIKTLAGERERGDRVIVAGDLNITPWSPYYRRFVRKTGLHNSRKGFGILPTWPVKHGGSRLRRLIFPLLQIPIDHCLISQGLETTNIYTGPNTGSDHKPVIVDLRVVK